MAPLLSHLEALEAIENLRGYAVSLGVTSENMERFRRFEMNMREKLDELSRPSHQSRITHFFKHLSMPISKGTEASDVGASGVEAPARLEISNDVDAAQSTIEKPEDEESSPESAEGSSMNEATTNEDCEKKDDEAPASSSEESEYDG
mmetsp:Transcript_13633/g.34719  ORF Transcript_13633/g.34719 Transcript_13633/m.34719 type:complete len:148 (-) Transcript_13633:25-468(-)